MNPRSNFYLVLIHGSERTYCALAIKNKLGALTSTNYHLFFYSDDTCAIVGDLDVIRANGPFVALPIQDVVPLLKPRPLARRFYDRQLVWSRDLSVVSMSEYNSVATSSPDQIAFDHGQYLFSKKDGEEKYKSRDQMGAIVTDTFYMSHIDESKLLLDWMARERTSICNRIHPLFPDCFAVCDLQRLVMEFVYDFEFAARVYRTTRKV